MSVLLARRIGIEKQGRGLGVKGSARAAANGAGEDGDDAWGNVGERACGDVGAACTSDWC